ncbi:MAG: SH3 domain-containing protein [Geminicoccaceae bacterium]|nr:SH3 domain-containing protein [Geminicoccaceae bacterium]
MNILLRTVAALALLGLCGLSPQAARADGVAVIAARAGAKVNVRGGPEVTGGNIVGQAIGGDRVAVLETAERGQYTWYRVRGPGGAYEGWVRGDLVAEAADAPASGRSIEPPSAPPIPTTPSGEATAPVVAVHADRPPLASRDDWSRNLIEFYPAISDCLKVSSAQPAVAVKALSLNGGLVDVVVRDAAERRWECIVRVEGGTPLRYDPVTWQLALPQRNTDPVFTPLTGEPPSGECFASEPVTDPASERKLGWLTYRICS